MRKFLTSLFVLSLYLPNFSQSLPNIVLIMTDDQGYGDLGFHGNSQIQTPILDAFARESTRFTQFYVSPVCAPTRSALMTGRYSLRTGVCDTYNGWAIMSGEEETLAEYLKDLGYATAISGKWHLGDNYPSRPMDQGFDYSLVHHAGGMAQVGDPNTWFRGDSAYFDPMLVENGKNVQKNGYCSDIFTDAALDFINKNREGPFFCYLAFNAPHTPLQLPGAYEEMYANLSIDSAAYPSHDRPFPIMRDRDIVDARRVYGMVSNIDDNVGRLLEKLDEWDLDEHTIVVFLTDNGPQQRRYVGGMRGLKSSVYEGGVHVPFFIRYPKALPPNQDIDIPAAHVDLVPTLLDMLDQDLPSTLDGKSLWPMLQGESVEWADTRPIFFEWNRGFPERYKNIAVRRGKYKLVGQTGHTVEATDLELYDLHQDPSEMKNISKENPLLAQELKDLWDDWYADIIRTPHLGYVPIGIGADQQNPVMLNRNDAKGSWGVWAQQEIYGYWDVEVYQSGTFDISCFFKEPLSASGTLRIRVGKVQLAQEVEKGSQEIVFQEVRLNAGEARVEAGFRNRETRKVEFPFWVEFDRVK